MLWPLRGRNGLAPMNNLDRIVEKLRYYFSQSLQCSYGTRPDAVSCGLREQLQ
jgi:hypothetical protein